MARVTLKNLLGRKKAASSVLPNLLNVIESSLSIEDAEGRILLGNAGENHSHKCPVELEGEILGYVRGNQQAKTVAALLTHLLSKEAEKKTLGQEVLHLYREINLIYKFSEKLAAALEPAAVAKLALDQASQMIRATGGVVMLLDEKKQVLEKLANYGDEFPSQKKLKARKGIVGAVASSGNAEIVNDVRSDVRQEGNENSISSLICAPLKVKERVIGVIALISATEVSYTAADLKLLNTLAVQTTSAIESALLHEKAIRDAEEREREKTRMALLEAENRRKSEELEEARQLQLSMLPKDIPQLPNIEIAVHMKTATEVGGDYYDFQVDLDGTLVIAIGDATGHGLKAGMMVSVIKWAFCSDAAKADITNFFNDCTRTIKQIRLGNLYMGLTLLKIKGREMTASAAGMPPFYIHKSESQETQEIILKAMPLGGFNNFPYQEKGIRLDAGDTILLLTDGLPELFNEKKEMFDFDRVKELFAQIANKTPQQIIRELVRAGEKWRNHSPQNDDISLIVLKIKQTA